MKAILQNKYGSPNDLHLAEIPKPAPTDDQILIKIIAVSLNGSDKENLTGKPFYARINGLFRPKNPIPGSDIAGIVEAVGKNATEFKVGDEIFGEIPWYRGGLAEYVCTDGHTMTIKPLKLSFEEAAAIPQAGSIAYRGIIVEGDAQPGQKVLINGGGGSGGSFAIPLAKMVGAEVTGVDNGHKLEFMRSLGADDVIDYTREDFTQNGQQYDLILDLFATRPVGHYERALAPNGKYFAVGGPVHRIIPLVMRSSGIKKKTGKTVQLLAVPQNREDLLAITELVESGKISPMIDKQFPLEKAADAFRYMLDGQAKGKLIINVISRGEIYLNQKR